MANKAGCTYSTAPWLIPPYKLAHLLIEINSRELQTFDHKMLAKFARCANKLHLQPEKDAAWNPQEIY